jgi:hypothetical protein
MKPEHDLLPFEELNKMEQRIQSRKGGRVRDLRLEIHQEGLVLRGRALTNAKQLAQHAVMEIIKVPIRSNEIEDS